MAPSTASVDNSASLRPRNRRRTIEDDETISDVSRPSLTSLEATATAASTVSFGSTSPAVGSRSSRPIKTQPNPQRSRSTSQYAGISSLFGAQGVPANFATSVWENSWSSIQGIASNLISGDASGVSTPIRSSSRKLRPFDSAQGRTTSAPPAQWGPSGPSVKVLGSGTREDRRAQVQAKKREHLLMAKSNVMPDSLGRYKRRGSDEEDRSLEPREIDDDRDAMVYVHNVRPGDTLAGVMIKYNCQPNSFRKANRLWPNDSIQVRKIVILPVDACGVRGRKITEPNISQSNIEDACPQEIMTRPTATQIPWADPNETLEGRETPLSSIPTSPSISFSLTSPEEPPWRHDSWVMIEGFQDAVEIARLSRRTLGYFPRSRRKSMTFSDIETPPASLELPRGNHQSSPSRPLTKPRSSSGSGFAAHLLGPGGVGTMSSNVRNPGPAQDGLNKLFSAHLPNLTPRSSLESRESHSSHSNGIENVSGAIEGWVRKIATKASTTFQPPTPDGRPAVGDLIELSEDAFEIGGSSRGDGGETAMRTTKPVSRWANESERVLQERTPPVRRI